MTISHTEGYEHLESIPGVGPSIAGCLKLIGVRKTSDLRKCDPEGLYDNLCKRKRRRVDRCVLYAFRCAVYYASRSSHNPELLKWWNWKNKTAGARR